MRTRPQSEDVGAVLVLVWTKTVAGQPSALASACIGTVMITGRTSLERISGGRPPPPA